MKPDLNPTHTPTARLPLIEPGTSRRRRKRNKAVLDITLGCTLVVLTLAGLLALGGYRFGGVL